MLPDRHGIVGRHRGRNSVTASIVPGRRWFRLPRCGRASAAAPGGRCNAPVRGVADHRAVGRQPRGRVRDGLVGGPLTMNPCPRRPTWPHRRDRRRPSSSAWRSGPPRRRRGRAGFARGPRGSSSAPAPGPAVAWLLASWRGLLRRRCRLVTVAAARLGAENGARARSGRAHRAARRLDLGGRRRGPRDPLAPSAVCGTPLGPGRTVGRPLWRFFSADLRRPRQSCASVSTAACRCAFQGHRCAPTPEVSRFELNACGIGRGATGQARHAGSARRATSTDADAPPRPAPAGGSCWALPVAGVRARRWRGGTVARHAHHRRGGAWLGIPAADGHWAWPSSTSCAACRTCSTVAHAAWPNRGRTLTCRDAPAGRAVAPVRGSRRRSPPLAAHADAARAYRRGGRP